LSRYLKIGAKEVTIYVGAEKQGWVLNEELLCDRVPYFKAAFSSAFKEGMEKTMELPEDNPRAFAVFVEWLYTNEIRCDRCSLRTEPWQTPGSTTPKFRRQKSLKHPSATDDLDFFALWVFADKLGIVSLAERVLQELESCCNSHGEVFSKEGLHFAYDNTSESSDLRSTLLRVLLRRYFVNYTAIESMEAGLMETIATSHTTLVFDLLKKVHEHTTIVGSACNIWGCRVHEQNEWAEDGEDEQSNQD
jgi:hypothetical protein